MLVFELDKEFEFNAGRTACDVFPVAFTKNYSHFLKDIEKTIGYRFNVNQRTVQGNWLKVQRQSTNGSRKSNSQKQKGSYGEFRRVLQPGGKKYRSHGTAQAAKM